MPKNLVTRTLVIHSLFMHKLMSTSDGQFLNNMIGPVIKHGKAMGQDQHKLFTVNYNN